MCSNLASPNLFPFYRRTFLERLVLYLFLSYLIVAVVFQLILGYWHFHTSREQQFVFFSLVALDYILTWRAVYAIRIDPSPTSLFAILLLFIALYGLAVGAVNGNRWPEIANDTIPIVILVLNVFRLQSEAQRVTDAALHRLLRNITLLALLICGTGLVAVLLGRPATYALSAIPIAVLATLVFSCLMTRQRIAPWITVSFAIVLLFSASDLNRTNLLFFLVAGALIMAVRFLRDPPSSVLPLIAIIMALTGAWSLLPEDSKTRARLEHVTSLEAPTRKTAVGERSVEFRSIVKLLERSGQSVDTLGLGHGALYEMRGANRYKKDYGHAHFSWALFKLRYGDVGYLLTFMLGGLLLINVAMHAFSRRLLDNFIMLLSLVSFIYMFTYVNFIFLLSGLSLYAHRHARIRHRRRASQGTSDNPERTMSMQR